MKPGRTVGAILAAVFAVIAATGGLVAACIVILALLGTPLFAVMGGASEIAWFLHKDPEYHHLRFVASRVLDEQFAGSPILVTIPLFTFVGYVLAESRTAHRLVRTSSALLGWLPGGLAIVCIVASAVFTLFTGGSGVTIIAIGGLLYPALRQKGYSEKFALGAVTCGGSVGLLLPYSIPLMVYGLVAGVDINIAFRAVLAPGLFVLAVLAAYAAFIGIKENIPREPVNGREMGRAIWELKWELGIPVLLVLGLKTGLAQIDECAALVALYTVGIEVFLYKDLSLKKDIPRIAKASMSLGGAVILILAMANALINFVIDQKVPDKVLNALLGLGLNQTWQFLIVMNLFLLVLGMLMEGFSAILVAVPLILPFAARFHLGPFHLAMIFLLNLELAYSCPPLGLNLFISSFRFNRPVVSLYRPVLPFAGVLVVALLVVTYVPALSNVMILGDIREARARAEATNREPREAWILECVQEDRSNPLPCTEEEKKKHEERMAPKKIEVKEQPKDDDDDLFKKMAGGGGADTAPKDDDDDLFKKMAGGSSSDAGASPSPSKEESEDDLFKRMVGGGGDGG